MVYMYQTRKFAIENLPTYKKSMNKEVKGIFADHGSDEEEDDTSMKYTERMHNMFFPIHW